MAVGTVSGKRVVVIKMDLVTGSGGVWVCQSPAESRGVPGTKGWNPGIEGAKVRVRGTETEIPSRATKN